MDNDVHAKDLSQLLEPSDDAGDTPRQYIPRQNPPQRQEVGEATDRRRELSVLGKSVVFKGEFEADEDLLIDGRVEGKITHRAEHLTIGVNGNVQADIMAQRVLVQGRLVGNIHATETIIIEPSAHVAGNLFAPRVGLKEGAEFDGRIQMTRSEAGASKVPPGEGRTASKEQPVERGDSRGVAKRSASSPKKAAAGNATGAIDASVDEILR